MIMKGRNVWGGEMKIKVRETKWGGFVSINIEG